MAKIKQTDEQQNALVFIAAALKDLEKLKLILESAEIELTAKAAPPSKQSIKLDLGEAKIKALLKGHGQFLAQDVLQKAAKYIIELDQNEKDLCEFFKSK